VKEPGGKLIEGVAERFTVANISAFARC